MRGLFAFAVLAVASAQILKSANLEVIDGEYIVVFHSNVTNEMIAKHETMLGAEGKVLWRYNMPTFKGYSVAHSNYNAMLGVAEDPMVDYVEHNGKAYAYEEEVTLKPRGCRGFGRRSGGLWGLARCSHRNFVIDGELTTNELDGAGVDVYIIDTGILLTHQAFGNRARHAFDCTGEGPGDQNGHGTHCAGTAAGDEYGIASSANLFEVKVLGRSGGGSFACVIAGIDFVGNADGAMRIGSLSLGGGFSAAVNAAVNGAVANGAAMASASGNSNANACNFSPASAVDGITVNSMQNNDARSGFSNFGSCTDIFAPGSSILSAWIGSNTAVNTISGTSMACPHVAGVAAELWANNPTLRGNQIQDAIIADSTPNAITNPGTGSPNRLAFTCDV